MPCTKCSSDFNLLNWKIKCGECEYKYCMKCLRKIDGILYCEKCLILLKRPPDRVKLMELKPKDLQDYLNKHNISTYGLVEKQELVDLFCNRHIPKKQKKGVDKLTANIPAPVPNFNDFLDSVLSNDQHRTSPPTQRQYVNAFSSNVNTSSPTRPAPPPPSAPPSEPQATTSSTFTEPLKTESAESSPRPKYPKITDFEGVEELNRLSAKELKQLLTLNRIDYKGCIEKSELLERAKRLWMDEIGQRKELPTELEDLCKLCMDAPLECVLLECGHIATCIDCGKKLSECPICRHYVSRVVRTFKA